MKSVYTVSWVMPPQIDGEDRRRTAEVIGWRAARARCNAIEMELGPSACPRMARKG